MKLGEIASAINGTVTGDPALYVGRAVHPDDAENESDLAIAMDSQLVERLSVCPARVAIVNSDAKIPDGCVDGYIRVGRSRYAMAGITRTFDVPPHHETGVHSSAVISSNVSLPSDVSVGAFVYIGPGTCIGAGVILMPHVTIGANAHIGEKCLIHSGARIGDRVELGNRVIIHPNASIGADGFSFVTPEPGSVESAKKTGRIEAINTEIVRINSIGTVVLGDDTEIGACTSIDRGTISSTRIGRGTKLDDLVMVGHNVVIGENCMICGQVGIAGSCTIGDGVVLAGQVGVADHLKIGNDVIVGGSAGVASNLRDKEVYLGTPAIKKKEFVKQVLMLRRLENLLNDIVGLKKRISSIEIDGKNS